MTKDELLSLIQKLDQRGASEQEITTVVDSYRSELSNPIKHVDVADPFHDPNEQHGEEKTTAATVGQVIGEAASEVVEEPKTIEHIDEEVFSLESYKKSGNVTGPLGLVGRGYEDYLVEELQEKYPDFRFDPAAPGKSGLKITPKGGESFTFYGESQGPSDIELYHGKNTALNYENITNFIEQNKPSEQTLEVHNNSREEVTAMVEDIFQNRKDIVLGDQPTLKNLFIEHEMNPAKNLLNHVHDEIGGFGWFGDRKKTATVKIPGEEEKQYTEDQLIKKYNYGKEQGFYKEETFEEFASNVVKGEFENEVLPGLSEHDIDEIVTDIFNLKVTEENINEKINRADIAEEILNKGEQNHTDYINDYRVNTDIASYTGIKREIADIIEKLNHGELDDAEYDANYAELLKLKEKDKGSSMLIDLDPDSPKYGQLVLAPNKKVADNLIDNNPGLQSLDDNIKQTQEEYANLPLGDLEDMYEGSVLALHTFNAELDEMLEFDTEGYDYTDDAILKPMSLKSYIANYEGALATYPVNWVPKGYTEEEWKAKLARTKKDMVDYNVDHEALKSMYLLNEGALDISKDAKFRAENRRRSFIEPFVGSYEADLSFGSTKRDKLDATEKIYNQLGFEISDEEKQHFEKTTREQLSEGFFGSGRMLAEFYGVGKILKPIQAVTGWNRYMQTLNSARYIKNGKTFSQANMAAKFNAANKSRTATGFKPLEFSAWTAKNGYKATGPGIMNGIKSTAMTGLLEGAKFELIDWHMTGEHGGFYTGFGFGAAGRMMAPIMPLTKLPKVKFFVDGVMKNPASFVVGSEAGETLSAIVDDALGNKQLSAYMDEHYSDYGTVGQRLLVNYTIGLGLTAGHWKNFSKFYEIKSIPQLREMKDTAYNKMLESAEKAGISKQFITERGWNETTFKEIENKLTDSQYKEFVKHWEVYSNASTRFQAASKAKGYFDPTRAPKLIEKDMAPTIKQNKQDGVETKIEVVNNKKLKKGQEKLNADADVGNIQPGKTYFDYKLGKEVVNTTGKPIRLYRFNAERYTPDLIPHEVGHTAFHARFGRDAVFRAEYINKMGKIASTIKLGAEIRITEAQARILGTPGKVGKEMTLLDRLKLEGFDLLNPMTKKVQIQELHTYLAQYMGNKSYYKGLKRSDAFWKMRQFISGEGRKNFQKYDLSKEKDVVRWFGDYIHSIKQGRRPDKLFEELDQVIDYELMSKDLLKMKSQETSVKEQRMQSLPFETKKTELVNKNKELFNKKPKGYEALIKDNAKEIAEINARLKQIERQPSSTELIEKAEKVNETKQQERIFQKTDTTLDNILLSKGMFRGTGAVNAKTIGIEGKDFSKLTAKEQAEVWNKITPEQKLRIGQLIGIQPGMWESWIGRRGDMKYGDMGSLWTSKRAEFVETITTGVRGKDNGLPKIVRSWKPEGGQKLTSYIYENLPKRMAHTTNNMPGFGKKHTTYDLAKETPTIGPEGVRMSTPKNVEIGIKKINKGVDSQNPNIEPSGIQLRNYKFRYGKSEKVTKEHKKAVEKIETKAEEVFYELPLEKLTYKPVADAMKTAVVEQMDAIMGVKEGMKPGKAVGARNKFISENDVILYESMPEFSNPKFYENSMIGKTILSRFFKNTGVKFKSSELPIELTKKTDARTTKWEKLEATPERLKEFVELMTTGRDNTVIQQKQKPLVEHVGKNLGNQIFRDLLGNKKFVEQASKTADGSAKIEGLKAELAIRKLKGAVPERLQSKDFNKTTERFIEEIKKLNFKAGVDPAILIREMILNDTKFKKHLNPYFDKIIADMGYKVGGKEMIAEFQKYAEAKRKLDRLDGKVIDIDIFTKKWKGANAKVEKILIDAGFTKKQLKGLNINESFAERLRDPIFANQYLNKFIPKLLNIMPEAFVGKTGMLVKSLTFSGTKNKWLGSDKVMTAAERNKILKDGKVTGTKEKIEIEFTNEAGKKEKVDLMDVVKTVKNGDFKKGYEQALLKPEFKDIHKPSVRKKFVDHVINDLKYTYVNAKGKTVNISVNLKAKKAKDFAQTEKANERLQEEISSKLFDYYVNAKNKIEAINNIQFFLQGQTNIEGGWVRSLATHTAGTTRRGKTHSEHELQVVNFTGNLLLNMIKNSGNKTNFLQNYRSVAKNFKQSIIPKELQQHIDSPGMGGNVGNIYQKPGVLSDVSGKANFILDRITLESMIDFKTGKTYKELLEGEISAASVVKSAEKLLESARLESKNLTSTEKIEALRSLDKAITNKYKKDAKKKGMSVWDFDDTLAKTKSKVITISPEGKRAYMNAAKWAKGAEQLLKEGYKFDFSEFNKVVDGKPGPFLHKLVNRIKKFGTKDQFILTARPAESAVAIREFLKGLGINIPLKNITGLANSTPEAKALWIAEKIGKGYNDIYFADDAIMNVQAVKNMMNQFDVKSKVVQARRMQSKNLNKDFNKILEETTGVGVEKTFSKAKATLMGRDKWTKSLMTAGNQDFMGLMQNFAGRGKKGEAQLNFFRENLQKPFAKAYNNMNVAKQAITNDYKALSKKLPKVKKKLNKKIPGKVWTYDQAIRVHRWTEAGFKIPDISKRDIKELTDVVKNDAELLAFSNKLGELSKQKDGYIKPTENWLAESVVSDLHNITMFKGREKYLTEFVENRKQIFGEWKNGKLEGPNMNKIEATQGKNFREALEDMLWRMETGTNRPTGKNKLVNAHMDFLNGAVGATMFFNTRSATLQLLSTFNFINWGDNNPLMAGKAFANQPRYWKDFAKIFNSDMLLQRRSGLKYNVSEAEIAQAAAQQGYSPKKMLAWLLKKGFLPTQIADSFAISAGGASFYRNRINTYKKQGLSEAKAKEKAWLDFQETAEVSQQSSRPDLISQNQAGPMGRTVLAWANTPMQYGRIKEKAFRDIINRRGDTKTHLSKLAYYGAIQSALFAGLQSALFAFALDEEDDMVNYDKYKKKDGSYKTNPETGNPYTEKEIYDLSRNPIVYRVANTMLDGELSGFGIPGKVVSTVKNTVMEFKKQEDKAYGTDHAYTMLQLFSYSPVLGSKARKFYSATQTWKYNDEEIKEMGLTLDNPGFLGAANVIEGITNIPAARALMKIDNLRNAADAENQWWQRVASFGGWSRWNLGIDNDELKEAKERVKIAKEYDKIEQKYKNKKSPVTGEDYTKQEIEKSVELFALKKDDQVDMLLSLGLSSKEIKALKYEEDRVNKIMELQAKGVGTKKKKTKTKTKPSFIM